MRLFSIIQWHHFAYMVIGLALLGYGMSGTVVSIMQHALMRNFKAVYISSIVLFGITSVFAFLLAQQIPFNSEELLWDRQQLWFLAGLFVLLSIPFFFAATAICLAFMQFKKQTAKIYAADLVGASLGSAGIIVLLYWLFPQHALVTIGIVSVLSASAAVIELHVGKRKAAVTVIVLIAAGLLIVGQYVELNMSPYKSLQQIMRISGADIKHQRSGPMGLLTVVENKSVPFRHAPGLSLNAVDEPPPQMALFIDGDAMSVINQFSGSVTQLTFLDYMPSALPYHLDQPGSALIVGGGGGSSILQSIVHQVPDIDVLEMNSQVVELVDKVLGKYSGNLYSRERINTHVLEVRDYLGETNKNFDLIQLSLLDAFNSSSSGLHALNESYLYTIEAIQLYLQHLEPGGYLALTRWVNVPPRDSLKLMYTVVVAMQRLGIEDVSERLMFIRGWQTATLVVKNGRFTQAEILNAKKFCLQRSFDVAWLPGILESEVNRFNRLESASFYNAARHLLSKNSDDFLQQYKFDLRPASDDRPYFQHFFKWKTFRELFDLRNQGGMSLIEWGYLILVAMLFIALLLGVVLILLPLWFFYRIRHQTSMVRRSHVVFYFLAIGFAFLMIEIAFMQKFILFLHHPIYSVAVILAAFLLFAGVGSLASSRLVEKFGRKKLLVFCIAGIVFISLVYLGVLGELFSLFGGAVLTGRILLTVLLISPLAFLMGMPFPVAMASLGKHAESYIPWAWAINGCASVISASLATLLAISFGFNAVVLIALVLYLTTLKTYPDATSGA